MIPREVVELNSNDIQLYLLISEQLSPLPANLDYEIYSTVRNVFGVDLSKEKIHELITKLFKDEKLLRIPIEKLILALLLQGKSTIDIAKMSELSIVSMNVYLTDIRIAISDVTGVEVTYPEDIEVKAPEKKKYDEHPDIYGNISKQELIRCFSEFIFEGGIEPKLVEDCFADILDHFYSPRHRGLQAFLLRVQGKSYKEIGRIMNLHEFDAQCAGSNMISAAKLYISTNYPYLKSNLRKRCAYNQHSSQVAIQESL